ncbi:hypothetical protein CEP54_010450 [Fusarium duplospermum]|uniref:Uncharacterized protein n=1 Tax=Fusarium duplospermum TaxID=1325734 RepID=A0A428PJY1_9HYPO|nr:hypothetical protein CEP54_010450 [Fusarium duplospermum]
MEQLRVVRYVPRSNILSPSRQDRTAFPPLPLALPSPSSGSQQILSIEKPLLPCLTAPLPLPLYPASSFLPVRVILSFEQPAVCAAERERGFCSIGKKGDRTKSFPAIS